MDRKELVNILISALIIVISTIILAGPTYLIRQNHTNTYAAIPEVVNALNTEPSTAIVLGGGVSKTGPRPTLAKRLDAAQRLYEADVVDTILLTGDNQSADYNEPQKMLDYLEDKGIPSNVMTMDPAGLSTYQSCERAAKVYGVDEAVIVSQAGHLDRAIYLCNHFGIHAIGYPAVTEDPFTIQLIREPFSNIKAVFNVWIMGERTLVDEPKPLR